MDFTADVKVDCEILSPNLNWVRRFVGNPTETQQYVDKENKVGIETQQVWTFSIDGRAMTMTMTMTRL